MSTLTNCQTYQYTEPEDCLMADPFGAESFHQYNQNMIDPSLESLRHHYAEYGLSYEGQYQPHARLPAAYDPVAHGFGYPVPIKHSLQDLYSIALSTDWHSQQVDGRSRPYVSPTASTMSLSRSTSTLSDMNSPPVSGCMLPRPPHYGSLDAYAYPSPPISEYQEIKMSYTPPNQPYPPADALLPSQPSFSMRDFEYATSDNADDDALGEEDNPPVHVTGPEELDISEEATPAGATQHRLIKAPIDESEADDSTAKANSDAEDIDSDTEYQPTSRRSTLRPPLSRLPASTRASPLLNPNQSRIHKSTPSTTPRHPTKTKSKTKPSPKKPRHSSSTSKLFPCPFTPFGCTATFPNKNEWKRHTTTQHLCLGFYRCDLGMCSMEHESGVTRRRGWNDFGRKDLFVQHGRRMHLHEVQSGIRDDGGGKGASKGYEALSREEKMRWEEKMKGVKERCWVRRREAPEDVGCSVNGCKERKRWGLWEERMEHVAGHWERGEGRGEGVDEGLLEWCVREGVVVDLADEGRWVLKGLEGEGARRVGRRGLRSGEGERVDVEESIGGEVEEEEDAAYEVE